MTRKTATRPFATNKNLQPKPDAQALVEFLETLQHAISNLSEQEGQWGQTRHWSLRWQLYNMLQLFARCQSPQGSCRCGMSFPTGRAITKPGFSLNPRLDKNFP